MSSSTASRQSLDLPRSNPWAHFLAGAAGGLAATTITSPLDVLKTRLQSSVTWQHIPSQHAPGRLGVFAHHVFQTPRAIRAVYHIEGWRGLFRGLGPSLSGVVPSMAIKFYVYGNCKRIGANLLGRAENTALVHAFAAVAASTTVATLMNPVFVVKTRLQLESSVTTQRRPNSISCTRDIIRREGVRGLYRGLGASYLGTVETVLHLVMYEQLKQAFRPTSTETSAQGDVTWGHAIRSWFAAGGASGSAKFAAIFVTYPHEVLRTRLRQAPAENGVRKYVGLVQSFRLIRAEEGMAGLYGGMTAHLMRSVPSAFITLGVYECVLNLVSYYGQS